MKYLLWVSLIFIFNDNAHFHIHLAEQNYMEIQYLG